MLATLAISSALFAPAPSPPFEYSIRPLSAYARGRLVATRVWQPGCPVPLSGLRILKVTHRGCDGRAHIGPDRGQRPGRARRWRGSSASSTTCASRSGTCGSPTPTERRAQRPRDNDISGSFECRQAVPSPCTPGRTGTGSWSMHAFGLAVDLNPVENPYVGCGMSRDPRAQSYRDRRIHRNGMITRRVVAAFRSIGWAWGGAWTGNTKDYMHFSATGD